MGTQHISCVQCVGFACSCISTLFKPLRSSPLPIILTTSSTFLFSLSNPLSLSMAKLLNWVLPPVGTLKINVHAVFFAEPLANGNTCGIGVVLRTSDGNLVNYITGTIPGLNSLAAQLRAIQIGLKRAFIEGTVSVIIETNNMASFGAIQFAYQHQHPEVEDLIQQILTRIRDPNWE